MSDLTRFIARHVVGLPRSGIRDFFDIVAKFALPFVFWALVLRFGEEAEKPDAAPAKGRRRKKKG